MTKDDGYTKLLDVILMSDYTKKLFVLVEPDHTKNPFVLVNYVVASVADHDSLPNYIGGYAKA